MTRQSFAFLALPLALSLSACGPKPEVESAASKVPSTEKSPEESPAKPASQANPLEQAVASEPQPMTEPQFSAPVDIGDFGSSEPAERKDMPTRGIITLGPESWDHSNGAHWETYTGTSFKAKRWGRYKVRLTYMLNRSSLGMQFRMADLVVKKALLSATSPRKTYLGDIYISQPGDVPFALLTPPTENAGFEIIEIALIPTCEGEVPQQAADGSIVLNAKDAVTWSENMRYEPKPEKNCLGFWTSEDDMAEWEFIVNKPGRYKVTVSQGCGGGNHGSQVELKHGDQTLQFTTQDTGGFQNWQEVSLGEIEIKGAGKQRLMIDPVNKVKSAVLDVQKVILTPVS